jgi:hypothetical protein
MSPTAFRSAIVFGGGIWAVILAGIFVSLWVPIVIFGAIALFVLIVGERGKL